MFPLYMTLYNMWPWGGAIFGPRNKLGRGSLNDVTYQTSTLNALLFRKNIFFTFPYISLCKTCDPQGAPLFQGT